MGDLQTEAVRIRRFSVEVGSADWQHDLNPCHAFEEADRELPQHYAVSDDVTVGLAE